MLTALVAEETRFLIVGAHALAVHGYPRATVDDLDIDRQDFTRQDVVAQLGLPPNRIDILTGVSGLTFARAWSRRIEAPVEGVLVPVLAMEDLVANKLATGRDKDRADVRGLDGR